MTTDLDRILEEVRKDKDLDKQILIETLEAELLKAEKNRYEIGRASCRERV